MKIDDFFRNVYVQIIGILCMLFVGIGSALTGDTRGVVVATGFIVVSLIARRKISEEKSE
ncbi:hypothetical protein [Arcanobacterium ihumii]|uniref:hypothetical protein n=1 Tax=Arcanobacterium ihumii TaxID=2138162 RepID=UPI000F53DDF0|nr:hypothetical protein [Arcanobacterium ihumii]